jgi:hypothetical protein
MLLFLLLPSAPAQEKAATTDLRELLQPGNVVEPFRTTRLSPEWIGIIRTRNEEPFYLRLSHVARQAPDENGTKGRIWVARMSEAGRSSFREHAKFYKTLPSAAEVQTNGSSTALRKWFGRSHGWVSAHGDGDRYRWTEDWVCFTRVDDSRLRWLEVTAWLSAAQTEKGHSDWTSVDKVEVSEGILRPADPTSQEERRLYKTADEIQAIEETAKEAKRVKIPQPLRDLVAAHEAPNDSDRKIYTAALAKIRRQPDAELFRQIASYDAPSGINYLAEILLDGRNNVEAWEAGKRIQAMAHALDALGSCHNAFQLREHASTLLERIGGGHIQIESPAIDLKVEDTRQGRTTTQSRWDVDNGNLGEAARAISIWFKAKL